MMWFLVFLGSGTLLAYFLISYARWNNGKLEKQGFKVVKKGHFLLGQATLTFEKCGGLVDIDLMRQYGPVFGLYEGREPQIFICDPELIRLITTKDHKYFDSKRVQDFGDSLLNEFVDFQPLEKWRTERDMLTPPFNSITRIKQAIPNMREAIMDYVEDIKQQIQANGNNGTLEGYCFTNEFFNMQTKLLLNSQFSLKTQAGSEHFIELFQKMMTPPPRLSPWLATITKYVYAFPLLRHVLPNTKLNAESSTELTKIFMEMVNFRREQNKGASVIKTNDFLDQVVEWFDDLKENPEKYKKVGINELSLVNMALMPFFAGQDQVTLIVGSLIYYMSKDPEIVRRVEEEVDQVWNDNKGILSHESLSNMPYLSACVLEATRLHPFFYRMERVCTEDWEEPSRGIQIKQGDTVIISIWATHRNPEYFEDGDEFQPERFLPDQRKQMHPYSFASFGFGPRNCLGKRYALEIMMLIMATLIRHLKFKARYDTRLNFLPAGPLVADCEPLVFDVEERIQQN